MKVYRIKIGDLYEKGVRRGSRYNNAIDMPILHKEGKVYTKQSLRMHLREWPRLYSNEGLHPPYQILCYDLDDNNATEGF